MSRTRSVRATVAASLVISGGVAAVASSPASAEITAPATRAYVSVPSGSPLIAGEYSIDTAGVNLTGSTDAGINAVLTPTTPNTNAFTLTITPKTSGNFSFGPESGDIAAVADSDSYGVTISQAGASACTEPNGEFALTTATYGAGTPSPFLTLAARFDISCDGTPAANGFMYLDQNLGPVATVPPTEVGEYMPLPEPVRLLDTRDPASKLGPADTKDIVTTANSSGVPVDALAVVVNVTGVAPSAWTFLSLYPKGGDRPVVSNLNPRELDTVANLATVKVGADDSITLYNEVGSTDAVVDVVGYYAPDNAAAGGGRFGALPTPQRVYDSREDGEAKLAEGETRTVDLTTLNPGFSGIDAVVVNVTVTNPTKGGYLTLFPEGVTTVPTASNLNFTAEQTVANLAVVTLTAGKLKVYNPAGTTDVVIDLMGSFTADPGDGSTAGRFVSIDPTRAYDSRDAGSRLGEDTTRDVNLIWLTEKYPFEYASVVANMTAVDTTELSYLTAFPADAPETPFVSNLNFKAGDVRPNQIVAGTDDDGFTSFYNAKGQTNLVLDVAGFFTR